MKTLFSITLILVFGLPAFGQTGKEQCRLTLKDAPALRNIKLGMSSADVAKIIGHTFTPKAATTKVYVKKEGDKYIDRKSDGELLSWDESMKNENERVVDAGEKAFAFRPSPSDSEWNGIQSLYLRFYKDKVFRASVDYDARDYDWKNIGEFVSIVSERFDLPKDAWLVNAGLEQAYLRCNGFLVNALTVNDTTSLRVFNTDTQNQINTEAVKLFIQQDKVKGISDLDKKKTFKP